VELVVKINFRAKFQQAMTIQRLGSYRVDRT